MDAAALKVFSFTQLKDATGNFKTCIYGRMFKGWVDENTLSPSRVVGTGREVAVKRFDQGDDDQYESEKHVGNVSHLNIVKLMGYCDEKKRFLVYEFVPNGSLPNHLFRKFFRNNTLSWENRLKITIGAAKGLDSLHQRRIIHRDVKPTAIMFDVDNNVKLSNFRFAISLQPGEEVRSAPVVGTVGYVDPEYVVTGIVSAKSDVYSFGVVLLQILTGLMACDYTRPEEQISLVDWAMPLLPHEKLLETINDAKKGDLYSRPDVASNLAELALQCIQRNPQHRPSMKEVVENLEHILKKHRESLPTQ